jgi:hypothetical protein
MSSMRKLTIIALLMLLSVISCTGFLVYKHSLAHHRACFRSYLSTINDDRLEKIIIHPHELFVDSECLQWEDDNKEIIYKHALYDIVKIESQGTNLCLLVVPDYEEEELKRKFSREQSTSSPPYLKLLKQLLDLEYVSSDDFEFSGFEKSIRSFDAYVFSVVPVFIATHVLPPDL